MKLSRRSFLRYVGAGATATLLPALPPARAAGAAVDDSAWTLPDGSPNWSPVAYPLPLPGDAADPATDAARLAAFEVRDDLVLPPGFRYDVVAQWGERFGPADRPDQQVSFGFNADYTGLVPVAGKPDEFWLIVNHEYISARPWLQGYAEAHGRRPFPEVALRHDGDRARVVVDGVDTGALLFDLAQSEPTTTLAHLTEDDRIKATRGLRQMCHAAMSDLGLTILHVRRLPDGRFEVLRDAPDHKRLSGVHTPTATFSNCSGATTPWGTFLSCEENFQDQVMEFVDPRGKAADDVWTRPLAFLGVTKEHAQPFEFEGLGQGVDPPLSGTDFGWVVHVDPATGIAEKLRTLGRFRHENVALRVEKGRPLAAYMGDDRRGGHVWKFVSEGVVTDPADPKNLDLLRKGTLHVAVFNADFTGRWVPLTPDTPLQLPDPARCASGHLWLPARPVGGHVAVGTKDASARELTVKQWLAAIGNYTGKPFERCTLGDLVRGDAQRALLTDAYVMANAAGGTPTARPEDIEVHPLDASVYVAFTDSTGSGDGSPDTAIFPDSRGENSRQYGAIYRIVEDGPAAVDGRPGDPAAATFTWGKFVSSGEASDGGGGFACADNLVFDPRGNLWMVCDITTPAHNTPVDRRGATSPGGKGFVGVFGNNALFMIPTAGPHAGVPFCFATGPMECELTGPTFTDDGRTLVLAVQHPGETHGARTPADHASPAVHEYQIATRGGAVFTQRRVVPRGSNFPANSAGAAPRPCVVCITRQA